MFPSSYAEFMWMCFDMPSLPLADRCQLPETPGIYILYQDDHVLYIGKTLSLRRRLQTHQRLQQFAEYGTNISIAWHALPHTYKREGTFYERNLISFLQPHLNGQAHTCLPCKSPPTNPIRKLRKAYGMTQIELATALQVNEVTVVRWEKGYMTIPKKTLIRIASFFGVMPSELDPELTIIPPPPKPEASPEETAHV